MKLTAITASALVLALTGCDQKTDTNSDAGGETVTAAASDSGDVAVSDGQAFADAAASSDTFEIETSKLALANSTSSAVKKFAQSMIDAHTQSTEKLNAAASAASPAITPNPSLTAEQQAKVATLKAASGKSFDDAYTAAQVEGHEKTLATLQAYSTKGSVPELKTFAATLVPTVTAHLNMAKSLKP